MQIYSARWSVLMGRFTLNGTPSAEKAEEAILLAASKFAIPDSPEGEVKIAAPCGMWDPASPVTVLRFLDEDGNTWLATGTRALANSPNASLVEADFRRRAQIAFGDDWPQAKKARLNGIRRTTRREMASKTPFRLSEAGALFICLQTGEVICVGHAGALVASDLVGRCSEWSAVSFPKPDKAMSRGLQAYLEHQEDSVLPWPSGTATLSRKRGESTDGCSVKQLNWGSSSREGADLLAQGWHPSKIQLQWGDGRWGTLDLTGHLASVVWPGKVLSADPTETIEWRLGRLREMDAQVSHRIAELVPTPLIPV